MPADTWQHLRKLTPARIALGRAGGSLPTAEVLKFSMDHALARDAVRAELDVDQLQSDLAPLGLPVVVAQTQAATREMYLQRPDLGRRLSDASAADLSSVAGSGFDVALIIADGLSALAAQVQTPAVMAALVPLLREAGLSIGPIVVVRQARVGLQDAIGSLLKAKVAVTLIGERPGLGTPDSLGAYLVFDPKAGKTDADRNCVSNIRPLGLLPMAAAHLIHHLISQALIRRLSGVGLKDDRVLGTPSPSSALIEAELGLGVPTGPITPH